jgi:KDO2-lipid IV(A) lauroyltransferase
MNFENKRTTTKSILSAATYYLSIPIIYMISLLPFRLLYLLSDFFFFVLYRIIGYRKQVVKLNLKNSFHERTEKELSIISRNFYHNFCDVLVETIKAITISKKELLRRCKLNPKAFDVFSKFADEHKSVIMVMGHLGNWEWACNSFNILSKHQLYVIYHPLTNKYFDQLMYRIRTRNGTKLIAMEETYTKMATNRNELTATVFVADQTPHPAKAYWTNLLGQDTPVYKGAELIAKKMILPVVYTSLKKVSRGYYEMHAEVLTSSPLTVLNGEISERFTRRLEEDIKDQPESWLWSHRRWKHKRSIA